MSKFQVFLKDNTRLDFDGKCNTYEIKQSGFCAFSNEEGNKSKILALIPKENILFTEAQKAVENYAVPSAFSAYWNAIKMEIKE